MGPVASGRPGSEELCIQLHITESCSVSSLLFYWSCKPQIPKTNNVAIYTKQLITFCIPVEPSTLKDPKASCRPTMEKSRGAVNPNMGDHRQPTAQEGRGKMLAKDRGKQLQLGKKKKSFNL